MKLYIPMIGWDYEGGIALGVYDTNQKARNRLDEYVALGCSYDRNVIIEVCLNEAVEIDI